MWLSPVRGALPSDIHTLSRILGRTPEILAPLLDELVSTGTASIDGLFIINRRMRNEANAKQTRSKTKQTAGASGGVKSGIIRRAKALRRREANEANEAAPSPSPSPNKETTKRKRSTVTLENFSFPAKLDTALVRQALETWLAYKVTRGEGYKSLAGLTAIMNRFEPLGPDALVKAVQSSMASNYAGLFLERQNGPVRPIERPRPQPAPYQPKAPEGRVLPPEEARKQIEELRKKLVPILGKKPDIGGS